MATSNSTDFSVTRNNIVKGALRNCSAYSSGVTSPTASEINDVSQALNMLAKNLAGLPGFKLWLRKRSSLTLAAKASFALQPTGGDLDIAVPVRILTATLKDGDNETPLEVMGLEEYQEIADKTATGDPTRFYYERGLSSGTLYLDMVPSDITKTIELTYHRIVEDFDAEGDEPDFPQHWYRPLKYLLALDIGPEFGGVNPGVPELATQSLRLAMNVDPETSDLYFQPGSE